MGGGGRDKGWWETLEEKRGRRLGLACVLPYLYHLTEARQVYKKHCKPWTSVKILVYLKLLEVINYIEVAFFCIGYFFINN